MVPITDKFCKESGFSQLITTFDLVIKDVKFFGKDDISAILYMSNFNKLRK